MPCMCILQSELDLPGYLEDQDNIKTRSSLIMPTLDLSIAILLDWFQAIFNVIYLSFLMLPSLVLLVTLFH